MLRKIITRKKYCNEPNPKEKENIIAISRRILRKIGIWVPYNNICLLIPNLALICFFSTIIVQIVDIINARDDINKFFEYFSVFSFCMMASVKWKSLKLGEQKWDKVLTALNSLENEQLSLRLAPDEYDSDGEDTEKCYKTNLEIYTEKFRSLSLPTTRVYFFTLAIFCVSPFIELAYYKIIGRDFIPYPHLFHGWALLDSFGLGCLIFIAFVEIIAALYTVLIHFGFDMMVFGLMIMLSGQFELLRVCGENIGGCGNGYDVTERRDVRAGIRIIRCHKLLISLERIMFDLNHLVRGILGIYYMVAVFTLCSVAIRLSGDDISAMEIISIVQYTFGCLIQLFLFCYYGDILLHKSSVSVGEGPYASAWWRLSPRVRTDLLLLNIAQARYRCLRAGPFNRLDLISFIQIVRGAYSYFAVLQK